jgi:chromosome segregation ATPase
LISPCPFVDLLLRGASTTTSKTVTDGQKQLEASLTSVEEALTQRATATQEALAQVLHNMQRLHEHNTTLAQQLASHSNDATLKDETNRLVQELASTRQLLDQSHAASRTATERLQAAEDRSLEAEERVKKLQNELADMEQQLSSIQRKFAAFKDGRGFELNAAPKDAATVTAAAAPSAPSAIDALQDVLAEEVLQLKQLLEKRASDLEKEKDSHFKTKL